MEIYQLEQKAIFEKLETTKKGLSKKEAKKRSEKYGPNKIEEVKGRPLIFKFLENFYHLFAILLWIGAALSFVADQAPLGYAIIAVVLINAIFSFWQEFKAEKATEALKELMPVYAKVIRDGEPEKILAADLVPGDLILLEEGDAVSADARVIENYELRTNDSALTGESHPRRKNSDPFLEKNVSITDAPNIIFSGTSVVSGSGRAIIYATGMKSEFGKIAYITQSIKKELSHLQKQMITKTKIIVGLAVF
ncbi:MAG: cation-transporting P-type ATPase, partial [Actinobacteria bacterium]